MTTSVTVAANHGWPVRVTIKDRNSVSERIVPRNKTEVFHVFDTRDISVHEIQPGEPGFTQDENPANDVEN